MKIKVDNLLVAVEFGRATPRPDQVRYYYQLAGYDDVVLITHGKSYPEWNGDMAVMLVDTETTTGSIICQKFPKAPARWRDAGPGEVTAVTIRPLWDKPPRGRVTFFSQAIKEVLGDLSI